MLFVFVGFCYILNGFMCWTSNDKLGRHLDKLFYWRRNVMPICVRACRTEQRPSQLSLPCCLNCVFMTTSHSVSGRSSFLKALFRLLQEFVNLGHSIVTMFCFMLGDFDFSRFYDSHNPVAGIILMLVYESVISILLLNLLVAMMFDSWTTVRLWHVP